MHDDQIVGGIDYHELSTRAACAERLALELRAELLAVFSDPPQVAVTRPAVCVGNLRGACIEPSLRDDLLAAPVAAARHQQSDPSQVEGRQPEEVCGVA